MSTFDNQGSSIDTWMRDTAPDTERSTSTTITVGESNISSQVNRGLIKWNLASIPSGSTVSSAVLSIWVAAEFSDNARTLSVYRVRRAWVENEATWNSWTTGNAWSTAGCGNTTTDREASNIGTVSIVASPAAGTKYNITLTNSKVEEWISGSFTNNGLLLQTATENADRIDYDSSESATGNEKPQLVIEYTEPEPTGGNPIFFSGGGMGVA